MVLSDKSTILNLFNKKGLWVSTQIHGVKGLIVFPNREEVKTKWKSQKENTNKRDTMGLPPKGSSTDSTSTFSVMRNYPKETEEPF